MGIASLVLGIIATLMGVAPGMFFVALPFGVIAIVLGVIGRKMALDRQQPTGTAVAGLILGIVGTVFAVLMWIMCQMLVSGTKSAIDKSITQPIKKAIEDAELKAKEAREKGVPLDQANAIKLTALKLAQDYAANEAAADEKYKGKTLEVTGTVSSVEQSLDKYLNVELEGMHDPKDPDEVEEITCQLVNSEKARALALKKGDKVTVVGRCDGNLLGVELKGCLLK